MSKASHWIIAIGVLGGIYSQGALPRPIVYTDYVEHVSVNIGGTAYNCTTLSDPNCAFISITAQSDTSYITAFDVPGAKGFENTLQSATIDIFFADAGLTPFMGDLDPAQLFVSVDQTNGGAGFGSQYSPTYPLATYGSNRGFDTYDLASNFFAAGFAPFCTDDVLCRNGQAIYATGGTSITITYPFRPVYSSFSSSLGPVIDVPEPATVILFGIGLVGLGFSRRKRAN